MTGRPGALPAERPPASWTPPEPFGRFVARAHATGRLVVQPRMGLGDPAAMREGLRRTRAADACTVGTLTLDSYTRVNDPGSAARALAAGVPLNGYPLVTHGPEVTAMVLDGVQGPDFPVQVRHGSADPRAIVAALVAAGLDATEGGPVSYCLPYSRTPLRHAVEHWAQSCELLAGLHDAGAVPHLETFGGCMLGQLCPPSLLVALSVLEGVFFARHGLRSVSLSFAQQTQPAQDEEAVAALRRLAAELLPDVEHHVVVYAYMGVYPRTTHGATRLLDEAARLAVRAGAARLIVKTVAESRRIPTVDENVSALERAAAVAADTRPLSSSAIADTGVEAEARALVGAVLDLDADIGRAFVEAFRRGVLDVPYCLHPDNAGRARSYLDATGRLRWADVGGMPLRAADDLARRRRVTADDLLTSLTYVERSYDGVEPAALSAVERATAAIRNRIVAVARRRLTDAGFTEPVPNAEPAPRSESTPGPVARLQAALTDFDAVFSITPTAGADDRVDVEIAGAGLADVMRMAEAIVTTAVRAVVTDLPAELAALGRDPDAFRELLDSTFHRVTHATAAADLHAPGSDDPVLDHAGIDTLSRKASRPFFVTDHPRRAGTSWHRERRDVLGVVCDFDLVAPEGHGVVCSGGERETDPRRLAARLRESGGSAHDWRVDLARAGLADGAGLTIDVERLTRYVCGLDPAPHADRGRIPR